MPWRRAGRGCLAIRPKPRGARELQMVPGLPREPAACGRGRLLSSFRGAAVPPLAPAHRRHAPRGRRPRAPPALLAPCDSARLPCAPPPPPGTGRSHPSRPGCGRGDDQCAPASRAPATRQALCTQVGASGAPARFVPAGKEARFVRPHAGAGVGPGNSRREDATPSARVLCGPARYH